jgi:ADP-heptose:LPS heptosyltransferase
MTAESLIYSDCRQYRGDRPCQPHKHDGRACTGCDLYDPLAERILIVKLDALGDVLRTTAILPAIRREHPAAQITWVTRRNARDIIQANPLVDRTLLIEEGTWPILAGESFDLALGLDADPLSASIAFLPQARSRHGFLVNRLGLAEPADPAARPWWHMGVDDHRKQANRKTYQLHIYELIGLSGPIEKPHLPASLLSDDFAEQFAREHRLAGREVIAMNTGGGSRWQCKKWTADGYVELIGLLRDRKPNAALLLLGGPEEVEFNQAILGRAGSGVIDGGCENSLGQFASLVALADVFVTPDSLGFHVATALDIPAVVLVGPTSPWELETYGRAEILHAELDCIGCYLPRCPKPRTCMEQLSAERVYQAMLGQIESR